MGGFFRMEFWAYLGDHGFQTGQALAVAVETILATIGLYLVVRLVYDVVVDVGLIPAIP